MYDNAFTLIRGYIGKTVTETEIGKSGVPYFRFSVGSTQNAKKTIWYQITVTGDQATALIAKKRINKGWDACVRGKLSLTFYRTKGGEQKTDIGVLADSGWVFTQEKVFTSKKHLEDIEAANEIDQNIPDETILDIF